MRYSLFIAFFGVFASLDQALAHDTIRGEALRDLYPLEAYTYRREFYLPVSGGHEIYVEESGNPDGKPVIFLHGGPGVGASPSQKRYFDPKTYRIIVFAQRGSPPSRYEDPLRENTTWHLVEDMEQIRQHLGIDKWMLFGGSWGSTLALAYAQKHPEHVSQMILRGIYLATRESAEFYFHPEVEAEDSWPEREALFNFVAEIERHDLERAYHRLFKDPDPKVRIQAKRVWDSYAYSVYEEKYSPAPELSDAELESSQQQLIETHYALHHAFFPSENFLFDQAGQLQNIPIVLIHAVQDRIVSVKDARKLARVLPLATLFEVPEGGHNAAHPRVRDQLVRAADRFRTMP